jgi:hypothetical protein
VTSQLRIRTHNQLNLVDCTPSNAFFANRSFITITTTLQHNNKNARLAVGHHCNSKDDWQWSWFTSLLLERNNLAKGTATTESTKQQQPQQPQQNQQQPPPLPTLLRQQQQSSHRNLPPPPFASIIQAAALY